jgi:NADH-quinone oxidoreductase subunit N
MNENPVALIPELCLLAGAIVGLLVGLFTPRARQRLVRLIAVAAVVAGATASVVAMRRPDQMVFDDSYAVDAALGGARITVLAATLLAICLSIDSIAGHRRETEFYVLLLLGALGTTVLAGANDLMLLVAAYLLASVPLYALAGFLKDPAGTEAALKYYLMGSLLGVVLLAGVTLLYGVGGATAYGPLRDTLDAAPHAAVTIGTVAVLAAVTMTLGNLAAFFQDSARRLLAYSTISQVGYLLMAVAAATRSDLALRGLLFYLAAYAITNLGAFAVVTELPGARRLQDYGGLFHHDRWLALALVICLLGLVGTPPTSVFVGKLTVFSAAIDADLGWLAVVAAVNTVASVFYYLRWIVPLFLRPAVSNGNDALEPAGTWTRVGTYVAAASSVLLGLVSGPVMATLPGAA